MSRQSCPVHLGLGGDEPSEDAEQDIVPTLVPTLDLIFFPKVKFCGPFGYNLRSILLAAYLFPFFFLLTDFFSGGQCTDQRR